MHGSQRVMNGHSKCRTRHLSSAFQINVLKLPNRYFPTLMLEMYSFISHPTNSSHNELTRIETTRGDVTAHEDSKHSRQGGLLGLSVPT